MKAYLLTTGTLFGLIGAMHLVILLRQVRRLTSDPGFAMENGVLGVLCVALAVWAFRLVRSAAARAA